MSTEHTTTDEDTPEEAALKEALRVVLLRLLDGPLTQRALLTLESTARAARDLMTAKKQPKGRRRMSNYGESVEDFGEPAMIGNGISAPLPNQAETFGATLVRELVAAAQEMHKPRASLSDLVLSAKMARDSGMTAVADQIEAQIAVQIGAGAPVLAVASAPVASLPAHQNGHSNGASS